MANRPELHKGHEIMTEKDSSNKQTNPEAVPELREAHAPEDRHESVDRRRGARDSPSLMMLVFIAFLGVLLYSSFVFNFHNRGNWVPYLIVVVCEAIIIFQVLLSLWTILSSGHNPRGYRFHNAQTRLYGPSAKAILAHSERTELPIYLNDRQAVVDVYITTYGEEVQTIRRTVAAALAMDGRHNTYILDDGKSEEVRALAAELGAKYIVREGNAGAKAGNINHALSVTNGEFFAILDADFVPTADFLYQTVPFFAEANVAFVQTPQAYGNFGSLISRGAGYMQSVFYRYILPGKNRFNAAFCVGTNVVFRRTAIEQIGGMYTDSKSEDVWTSLELHEHGWKSIYISTVLATGDTPETIEAYTKQQLRWATGGFEILLKSNPFSRKRKLTLDQRLQYFGTATFYLTGITPGLLLLVPPMQIYLGLMPINSGVAFSTWLFFYLGMYGMQVLVALYTIGSFRWETLMLATASFPIYGRALVNAVFRRDQKWHVTGSTVKKASPFNFITQQLMAFVFLLITSAVGIWQAMTVSKITLALGWNLLNTFVLGLFVLTAFREAKKIRRENAGRRRAGRRAAVQVSTEIPAVNKIPALSKVAFDATEKSEGSVADRFAIKENAS